MEKEALLIGIDDYTHAKYPKLHGCVTDANNLSNAIRRNADSTPNFHTTVIENCDSEEIAMEDIVSLFEPDGKKQVVLFYFAGHGNSEGNLILKDGSKINMSSILKIVSKSNILNKIIIFDCCFAGQMAADPFSDNSILPDGVTIMTACTSTQKAGENISGGIFTQLLVNALNGGAADFLGHITIGGIYAYIDKLLGASKQRPVLKTNVKSFALLKSVTPQVPHKDILKVVDFFKLPDDKFKLDSSFEPANTKELNKRRPSNAHEPWADPENTKKFAILQKMNRIGLVIPYHDNPELRNNMFDAAMDGFYCELTEAGKLCWRLVKEEII